MSERDFNRLLMVPRKFRRIEQGPEDVADGGAALVVGNPFQAGGEGREFFRGGAARQTNQEAQFHTAFCSRSHRTDAARGIREIGLAHLSREAAIHAEQGLWNGSRPVVQLIIAEIAILFDEVDLAQEAECSQK